MEPGEINLEKRTRGANLSKDHPQFPTFENIHLKIIGKNSPKHF